MKKYGYLFLIPVVAALLFTSTCSNDKKGNENTDAETTSGTVAPSMNPGDSREVRLLIQDYWVFEYYVVDDEAEKRANKGRWYSFSQDGTFETGLWTELTTKGTWTLDTSTGKNIIQVDAENDAYDTEWEIQGINQQEDIMTWVGTKNYNNSNAIVKVISLLTRPTKEQFGVQE